MLNLMPLTFAYYILTSMRFVSLARRLIRQIVIPTIDYMLNTEGWRLMKSLIGQIVSFALLVPMAESWGQTETQPPLVAAPAVAAPANDSSAIPIDFGGVFLVQLAQQKSVQADLGMSRAQKQNLDILAKTSQRNNQGWPRDNDRAARHQRIARACAGQRCDAERRPRRFGHCS